MAQSTMMGWEGGRRVPVSRPKFEDNEDDHQTERDALALVRRLVGTLMDDAHPALGIECLAIITGIGYDGSSMEEIAKRYYMTRADVSKRCIRLCEAFGIPPTRAMRSEKNRDRCRTARLLSLTKQ
jgi:hypothetical protein